MLGFTAQYVHKHLRAHHPIINGIQEVSGSIPLISTTAKSLENIVFSRLFAVVLCGILAACMLFHNGISALFHILGAAVLFFSALWVVYPPNGLPKKEATYEEVGNTGASIQTINVVETTNEAYCSLVKHILLLLFTKKND